MYVSKIHMITEVSRTHKRSLVDLAYSARHKLAQTTQVTAMVVNAGFGTMENAEFEDK